MHRLTMYKNSDLLQSVTLPILPMVCMLQHKIADTRKAAKAQLSHRRPQIWHPNRFPLELVSKTSFRPVDRVEDYV